LIAEIYLISVLPFLCWQRTLGDCILSNIFREYKKLGAKIEKKLTEELSKIALGCIIEGCGGSKN